MLIRRLPPLVTDPFARTPHRVARRNAAQATLEARQRRREREDVDAFLTRLTQTRQQEAELRRR